MPRDFPIDPEVEADRRRRESAPIPVAIDDTAHDDPRLRRLEALYGWRPPEVVESWPCRGCSTPVGMTGPAIDAAKACNRILAARGEKLLSKRELAVCEPCRANEIADELRGLGADVEQILREAAQANETRSKAQSARSKSL